MINHHKNIVICISSMTGYTLNKCIAFFMLYVSVYFEINSNYF